MGYHPRIGIKINCAGGVPFQLLTTSYGNIILNSSGITYNDGTAHIFAGSDISHISPGSGNHGLFLKENGGSIQAKFIANAITGIITFGATDYNSYFLELYSATVKVMEFINVSSSLNTKINTPIIANALPVSASGLPSGSLWNNSGSIKII